MHSRDTGRNCQNYKNLFLISCYHEIMSIFLKRFAKYFFILLSILIFVKIIIITWLVIRGEWITSPSFLWSIIEWNKEALKIFALIFTAIILTIFHSK